MAIPTPAVEIALGADLTASPTSWTWTDITSYVLLREGGISITRGYREASGEPQPTEIALMVNNADGRFTPRNPTGAWYGQIGRNTPLRVRVDNGAGYVDRALGYIDEWPVRWDPSERHLWVPLVASGIMRRLTQGNTSFQSALRRVMVARDPLAYWPCEDQSGSTHLASGLDGGAPMSVYADAPTTVDYADDDLASGSLPLVKLQTASQLSGPVPVYTPPTVQQWTVAWAMRIPVEPATTELITVNTLGAIARWVLEMGSVSSVATLQLKGFDAFGNELLADTPGRFSANQDDEPFGKQLIFTVKAIQDGANIDWTVQLAGPTGVSGHIGTVAGTLGSVASVAFGPEAGLDGVTIGHVAVFDDEQAISIADLQFCSDGYAGETTRQRGSRLGFEEGVSTSPLGLSEQGMGPQGTGSFLDQFREIAETESGLLYETKGGLLRVRFRERLENQTAALALDYAQRHIRDIQPTDDDQQLRNDVTASRPAGSSAQYVATGDYAPEVVGRYADTVSVNVEHDTELPFHAQWRVALGTVDDLRYPYVTFQLHRHESLIDAWMATDVGDRVTVANPPSWLPPEDIDLHIAGYVETISARTWEVVLTTVSARPWQVVTLEAGSNRGRLDTAGSQLMAAVDADDTTLLVGTTIPPKWSTTAEPYDLALRAEQATATAVSDVAATFVNVGTVDHGNNASVTPGMPASIQAGDLLVCFAAIRNSGTGVPDTPDDWARLEAFDGDANAQLFVRTYVSGDAAPTVTFSDGAVGADTTAQIAAFRRAQPLLVKANTQLNASAQNITYPALTLSAAPGTNRDSCVIIYAGWKQDDWTSVASPGTEIAEPDTVTGSDQGIVWAYQIQTTATDIASGSFTVTGGTSQISRAAVVALAGDVQTVTVTRSVNGVSLSHPAGTAVKLYRPSVLAL